MDDLRRLLLRQQREVEELQRRCDARAAAARKAPTSPHLVQLRKLHATLSRQQRHLEALEVLRTLESLEWRAAEAQRQEAEEEYEVQLEALLQRHARERRLLEHHLQRSSLGSAVDLASDYAPPPLPPPPSPHRHRRLRVGTAPYHAQRPPSVCSLEPELGKAIKDSCPRNSWEAGGCWGEQHADAHSPCSPRSLSSACRAHDVGGRAYRQQWECDSWEYSQRDGAAPAGPRGPEDARCWETRPSTAATIRSAPAASLAMQPHPPPLPRQSCFSVGREAGAQARALTSAAPAAVAEEAAPAPAAFDSADWDVFCTLQQVAQQWSSELPAQPPAQQQQQHVQPQTHPSGPAAAHHGSLDPQPLPASSPLAKRLAQLKGCPAPTAPHWQAEETCTASSVGAGAQGHAACTVSSQRLPSIHGRLAPPQQVPPQQNASVHCQAQQPWCAGAQSLGAAQRPAASLVQAECGAQHEGAQTVPPASRPPGPSPKQGWLPQLLGLLLSARASAQPCQPCAQVQGCQLVQQPATQNTLPEPATGAAQGVAVQQQGLGQLDSGPLAEACQVQPADAAEAAAREPRASTADSQAPPMLPATGAQQQQQQQQQPVSPPAVVGVQASGVVPQEDGGVAKAEEATLPTKACVNGIPNGSCRSPGGQQAAAMEGQPLRRPEAGCSAEAAGQEAAHLAAALHDHCRHGRYDEARALLREPASVPVDTRDPAGNTPLMLACAGGHGRLVKLLLRKGAALNAQNEQGGNALLAAAAAGHRAVARHLLQAGADPALRDQHGASAEALISQWATGRSGESA